MDRCKNCKFFEQGIVSGYPAFGHCDRWNEGYSYLLGIGLNEVKVENDEGWGNVVGPEFGCVLFEKRDV